MGHGMALRGAMMAGLLAAIIGLLALPSSAQNYVRPWTGEVGFGGALVVGGIGQDLSSGWEFRASFGRNLTRHLELGAEYEYDALGVTSSALRRLNQPAGDADLWSISAEPRWTFSRGKLGWYWTGGVGYYRRTVQFLQPTVASTIIFNPWWGYIGPVLVPASIVLGSISEGEFGANAGLGISARLPHSRGARVFAEIDYRWAHTHPTATTVLPITIGLRW